MATKTKEPSVEKIKAVYIGAEVCDAAMHIIHESYLFGSDLWPVGGFKAGGGWGSTIKDCIYYAVNPYGWEKDPAIGRLAFNIYNTPEKRQMKQVEHIRLILDFSFRGAITFEDEFKNTSPIDRIWFKFTYTPNN
jgi:hypothetical protein